MKRERGFSFIEVVIALGVLGIIAVGFLSGLGTASKGLLIADERETANNLAEAQIESIKRQEYDANMTNPEPQYDLISDIPSGYSIDQPMALRLDRDGDPSNDEGIQKIVVTVRHNGKEVLTLEDYKVNYRGN